MTATGHETSSDIQQMGKGEERRQGWLQYYVLVLDRSSVQAFIAYQ